MADTQTPQTKRAWYDFTGLSEEEISARKVMGSDGGVKVFGDGIQLLKTWRELPMSCDGTAGLVLAEWMEDNISELMAHNKTEAVEWMMNYFMQCAQSEHNNHPE